MTRDEIKQIVLQALGEIAPEADLTTIKPDLRIRDQVDLDSMDMLNFIIALHKTLQIEIPESDYPKLLTLDDCSEYLASRLPPGSSINQF
jgi:acyl carrier protein